MAHRSSESLKPDQVLRLDLPGDATEVDRQRRRGDDALVVDVGVGGDDRRDVGAAQAVGELDVGEAVAGQLGDEGVVVGDLGAEVLEPADDLQRRRFADVADAALVADLRTPLRARSIRSTQKPGWAWFTFPASSMNSG